MGRLRISLLANAIKRYRLLREVIGLLQGRTRCVGINQIRKFYYNAGDDVQPWVGNLTNKQEKVGIADLSCQPAEDTASKDDERDDMDMKKEGYSTELTYHAYG